MCALRRGLLAGLMVAVVVLAGACSPPEPGSPEWLVGTWQGSKSGGPDREMTITFNADGAGQTYAWRDGRLFQVEAFRYSLVGLNLTVTELGDNGENKHSFTEVLSALTPVSFAMTTPGGRPTITLTRQE